MLFYFTTFCRFELEGKERDWRNWNCILNGLKREICYLMAKYCPMTYCSLVWSSLLCCSVAYWPRSVLSVAWACIYQAFIIYINVKLIFFSEVLMELFHVHSLSCGDYADLCSVSSVNQIDHVVHAVVFSAVERLVGYSCIL